MAGSWPPTGYRLLSPHPGDESRWRATDLVSGEPVTLRRLPRLGAASIAALRRDAAVLSAAAGDHVAPLADIEEDESGSVVVAPEPAGGSLAAILAVRRHLAAPEVVTLVTPLAQTLALTHARGLVHGEIDARTIVFAADGRPLLADFGVARAAGIEGTGRVPSDDVHQLCQVARSALNALTAPPALVRALEHGLADDPAARPTADRLALAVMRACAAAPVRLAVAPTPARPAVVPAKRPSRPGAPQSSGSRHRRNRVAAGRHRQHAVLAAVGAAVLAAAIALGYGWGHHPASVAAVLQPVRPDSAAAPAALPVPRTTPVPQPSWRAIVADLDRRRTMAFATGDVAALDELYVDGSAAQQADSATLQLLVRQGRTAQSVTITPSAVELLRQQGADVVLRVFDTISPYRIVTADGQVVRRVAGRPVMAWTLTLRRIGGEWRISRISR